MVLCFWVSCEEHKLPDDYLFLPFFFGTIQSGKNKFRKKNVWHLG